MDVSALPIELTCGLFALAAVVIGVAGTALAGTADRLADRTGLGEAVAGAVLMGMSTSLSGTVTSVSAALDGQASLAVANAVGGIAVQTVFLVVADLAYRKVNLEHAAADAGNLLQAALLLAMLALPLAAYLAPAIQVWAVHPVTFALPLLYVFGVRTAVALRRQPMWRPEKTADTRADLPDEPPGGWAGVLPLLARFLVLAGLLGAAGYVVARTGGRISTAFGLSETLVGALLTATATSLPELVTTLSAVRRGALQLAVGGIIGGNTFDVLFLSLSDAAYREGSIYHAMGQADGLLIVTVTLMTSILLMGLVMRERRGIGFEGVAIIVVYLGSLLVQIGLG